MGKENNTTVKVFKKNTQEKQTENAAVQSSILLAVLRRDKYGSTRIP